MNRKQMETKALAALGNRVEKVYDIYTDKNMVEVFGSIGGDAVRYRVYFDGDHVERIVEK